ncbi:MAG TPA: DNA/RNA non-specific endonuclease [Gemmatimonadales bacterium]|jgi:DNA/RNA endonuclease G (NUC1)/PKD repeat protein|nr:DNA/RNA non-specific endonuclease [Gemmatimonadales bacterium]
MQLFRSPRLLGAVALFAFVSCNPGDRVAPLPGLQADVATLPAVRISEIHYDNTGTDAGEAIEVSGPAGIDVTGWTVVLYNGNGGASYDTKTLTGAFPATCDARGVIVINYPVNGIQNGSPDGVALVNASAAVVEFLSYEGTFTATNGPANGLLATDIGVTEAGTETLGMSLQRHGDGTWTTPVANTFGSCNDNDAPPPPPTVTTVTVAPAAATIATGGTQTFTATAFDAANAPIAGVVFTWSGSAPAIATVNANGVATGVAAGDADITATAPNGVAGSASLHVNAPSGMPDTRFSEIHYDNSGTDVGEAIEVEGPAGTDLTGWTIVLYNGDPLNRAAYNTQTLTGSIPALCDGRGVVAVTYPTNGIQNGSPDGFALVDAGGHVVEFLSYEGAFVALGGPADGLTSVDMVALENSSPVGQSLQRNTSNVWSLQTATFGVCNGAPPPPPANTITFTGRLPSDPPLPVGFEDQLFATLRDGLGQPVVTTFTWTSESPALASIDQNGVMHALGAGSATFRATAGDGTTAAFTLPMAVATASTTALYAGNTEFGEPADDDPSDDFIVRHDEYTSSYNVNRGTPNWVSYDLDPTHFGPEDRCDCFTFDPALPAAFPRYTTADYTGAGAIAGFGIDRGHMTRSFDRTSSSLDNAFTFYFSNVVPQASDLNQGPWAILENFLGDLVRFQSKEVYIITGPAGNVGTLKNEGKVVIPASTWKVAVIMPHDQGLADIHDYRDLEVIAVNMPNVPGIRNVPWETYKTTVDAIEALTGYDLLANLPDGIERIVEANDHAPTASAGGPYAGIEGSAIGFTAAGSTDPDGDALSYAWDFGDGTGGTGTAPTHAYADNGTYTALVVVTDLYGAADTAEATVNVNNAPPVITSLTTPASPVAVGVPASIGVTFTDAGTADTHTLTVDWGDGTTSSSTSHAYASTGLFTVTATVQDDDGGADTRAATDFIVVYDPSAGFATGGGWFTMSSGNAHFAFVVRYQDGVIGRGASVDFQIQGTDLALSSESVDWLVLGSGIARVRGIGSIKNRAGAYGFQLTAIDGSPDAFRIKIWDSTGAVVYDNQPGARDDATAASPLGGGNISVKER